MLRNRFRPQKNSNEPVSFFRKAVKVILWGIMSFILLFILLALLIQIPAIQTKVVQYATSFVSKKTHTRVEIEKVGISFPKSAILEGLFLEDLQKDTLIYAGKAKVNMALFGLFSKKIAISGLALEDVILKLYSTNSDPLFNYNFLLAALRDTTMQIEPDTVTVPQWNLSLDKINLQNFRLLYHDEYEGMNVDVILKNAEFSMKELNLRESVFSFDDLLIDGSDASIMVRKGLNAPKIKTEKALPLISAEFLQINNSNIRFTDSVSSISFHLEIDSSRMETASVILQDQSVMADYLYLSESTFEFQSDKPESFPEAIPAIPDSNSENKWKVTIPRIVLADNTLIYKAGNSPAVKNAFDPAHLVFYHLMLDGTDFYYSSDQTRISVKKFSATDQNNFAITRVEGELNMDRHSITAKKLKANTTHSGIDADLVIHYSSLSALMDSMQFSGLDLNLKSLHFRNSDILYFKPDLIQVPFFKNSLNRTTASGKLSGEANHLNGENLDIRTGRNTILKTDFMIMGLPEVQTATYSFPNLRIVSGKKDIEMLAGPSISQSIELPGNLSMQISFKGKLRAFETFLQMNSSFGDANLTASVSEDENFKALISLSNIDLGSILRDTMLYGPVSLTAETAGQGLDAKTLRAQVSAEVSEITLKRYAYHDLSLEGTLAGREFSGTMKLDDENAAFDLAGMVNFTPDQEHVRLRLNVQGADLQKLHFSDDDFRIGLVMEADFRGRNVNQANGTAGIHNLVVASGKDKYYLDSVLVTSVNEPGKSELRLSSAPADMIYSGNVSPADLPGVLSRFISNYFPVSVKGNLPAIREPSDFELEIRLRNHPILTQLLLPQLKEFESALVKGSFNSSADNLKLTAEVKKLVYGSTEVNDFAVDVNSNSTAIDYRISSGNVSNSLVGLDNFLLDGKLADQTLTANLSSIGENQDKKLLFRTQTVKVGENYRLTLDPEELFLMNVPWDIAPDNYVEFGKGGFLVHHIFMNNAESQLYVTSVNERFNDDVSITMKNFRLDDFSSIVAKDTSLVKGSVDGDILLKRVGNKYGLVADATINNLMVRETPLGNLSVRAENPVTGKFDVVAALSGNNNQLTAKGYYLTDGGGNSISMELDIESLSLKTIEAFSMGQISEAEGTLEGKLNVQGKASDPEITGEVIFNNALFRPALLNNRLELKHETVQFNKDGIVFNGFTVTDGGGHTAVVDGSVFMKQFKDFIFALQVTTQDFLLMNTSARNNKNFYGRLIIDSRIDVSGPLALPVINAKIKLKKGSNFTFAVPEEKYTTDIGEEVVEFEDSLTIHSILNRDPELGIEKYGFAGFDLTSIIEIDKQATLRLLIDPASSDSLVVRGEAALSFTMDPSGKMSLTGAYHLDEGSYLVSLESIVKKRFDINPGSTIIWNGDPFDAEISINATHEVRAAPYDLVAAQMTGKSASESGSYKQRYPFLVLLKLRGELLHPVISFEIKLPPEEKGILGGAVDQKLTMLNEDPSSLNKQVFALLVLGRFIQDNPFVSESGGTSALIRSTVGKFLSSQLNMLTSKALPGVGLHFDIQSYDDYQSGTAEGRTELEIGIKKQLFNERLSVQVGGAIDLEGERRGQNNASDITSDFTIEYKLTKNGRYRLRGFRHNQYEGAIEGQLVETGVGAVYTGDFDGWKEFFQRRKKRKPAEILPADSLLIR